MMAIVEIEDLTGSMEAVLFPEKYDALSAMLITDAIVDLAGKIDTRGERRQVIVEDVRQDLPAKREAPTPDAIPVEIRLPATEDVWRDISLMQSVLALLERYEGDRPVDFLVSSGSATRRFRCRNRQVEWSESLVRELSETLGPNSIQLDESNEVRFVA